jgi:hypothetical protein
MLKFTPATMSLWISSSLDDSCESVMIYFFVKIIIILKNVYVSDMKFY